MPDETETKRTFALRDESENETSVFSGRYPRQAALKTARRLSPAESENEAEADQTTFRLRERGTDTIHVYDGWAWIEPAGDDAPEWVGDTVTQANVSKQGIEHIED